MMFLFSTDNVTLGPEPEVVRSSNFIHACIKLVKGCIGPRAKREQRDIKRGNTCWTHSNGSITKHYFHLYTVIADFFNEKLQTEKYGTEYPKKQDKFYQLVL